MEGVRTTSQKSSPQGKHQLLANNILVCFVAGTASDSVEEFISVVREFAWQCLDYCRNQKSWTALF